MGQKNGQKFGQKIGQKIGRKRGGQPGNRNRLSHGRYSKAEIDRRVSVAAIRAKARLALAQARAWMGET